MLASHLDPDRLADWIAATRARTSVVEVAMALSRFPDLQLLVFKGAHLAALAGDARTYRFYDDVDVAVVRGSFDAAIGALRADAQFSVSGARQSALVRVRPSGGIVDLQRRALPRFLAPNTNRLVLSRALRFDSHFGPQTWVPRAADAAVISLAHLAKDGFLRRRVENAVVDLKILSELVTPADFAVAVAALGARRAVIASLAMLDERAPAGWLSALADAAEVKRIRRVAEWVRSTTPSSWGTNPFAHPLLADRIADRLAGVAWGVVQSVRFATLRRLGKL